MDKRQLQSPDSFTASDKVSTQNKDPSILRAISVSNWPLQSPGYLVTMYKHKRKYETVKRLLVHLKK